MSFWSLKVSKWQILVTLGSLKYIFETQFNYIGKVSTLTRELYLLVPIRLPSRQSFLNKIEDICCTVECGVVSPHRVVTSNASTVPTPASYLDWLTLNSINIRWSVITAITLSYPSLNNANNGGEAALIMELLNLSLIGRDHGLPSSLCLDNSRGLIQITEQKARECLICWNWWNWFTFQPAVFCIWGPA